MTTAAPSDVNVTVAVASGGVAFVRIEWPNGLDAGDTTLSLGSGPFTFYCRTYDADSSRIESLPVIWSVSSNDSIGLVSSGPDSTTVMTLMRIGTGKLVAAYSPDIVDTSGLITVKAGPLHHVVVTPDTASLKVGNAVQFTATGYDVWLNVTDIGTLAWKVVGEIGTIDTLGYFVANKIGVGRISATSSINSIVDTTGLIVVDLPVVRELPLGNFAVTPGGPPSPILAFQVVYSFGDQKKITGFTLRNSSRGRGSKAELLGNIERVSVYLDTDGNQLFSASDQLLSATTSISETVNLSFAPILVGPGLEPSFFVAIEASRFARDGDSLDMFLQPGSDIQSENGGLPAGPAVVNSLGYGIVDGLVASQVSLVKVGSKVITNEPEPIHLLTVRVPRNGYEQDTLTILSLENHGTASENDLDSLILYRDNGDEEWGGSGEETLLGALAFTGNLWSKSGLKVPLTGQTTTMFIGAKLSKHPSNDATISLGIPLKGLEMTSLNDGPRDVSVSPIDTFTISSPLGLFVELAELGGRNLIPGKNSGPVLGIELINTYPEPIALDSLSCLLYAIDPFGASQSQLDSQVDSISVWLNADGNYGLNSYRDRKIATGRFENGRVVWLTNELTIPANGGSIELFFEMSINLLNGKDGNLLNLGFADESNIYLNRSAEIVAEFPVKNAEDHLIDAFPAAATRINAVAGRTLSGGEVNVLVLDFELPGDGYSDAQLNSLRLANFGTLLGSVNSLVLKLWSDLDGNGFSTNDVLLGNFGFSAGGWSIGNLASPLTEAANRLFVTIDVPESNLINGGTIRLGIPVQGVRYLSNTSGPDDSPISNPEAFSFFPANEITIISNPFEPSLVNPGALDNWILSFALYNGYSDSTFELRSMRLTNWSYSKSSALFADQQLGRISLYRVSSDPESPDSTTLLGTGHFSDGTLIFSGLDTYLMPKSVEHVLVKSDLPLRAIDLDTLRIALEEQSDLVFDRPARTNGNLPLYTSGYLVVDGSVYRQYGAIPVSGRSLSPGESGVLLFALTPAPNGDLVDTLRSLTLINLHDADSSEFSSMQLWLDKDRSGLWSANDSLLGQFVPSMGQWTIGLTSLPVWSGMPPLLVVCGISIAATPNTSIQMAIPLFGCQFASGNDGPLDLQVAASGRFVISDRGLRLRADALNPTYTIGQNININAHALNTLPDQLDSVYCTSIAAIGPATVTREDGFFGPVRLFTGEEREFTMPYRAINQGLVQWQLQAYADDAPESSAVILTEPVTIQSPPSAVNVHMTSSLPRAVSRGQSHVFPLSLSYSHADTSDLVASLRQDSLVVNVLDINDLPQAADQVFSRMILTSNLATLAVVDRLPSQSEVVLRFDRPVITAPGENQILSLRIDIDRSAVATDFALAIANAEAIAISDLNARVPVLITSATPFPLKTASCTITNPTQTLAVSYEPVLPSFVNYGQVDVGVVKLALRHPGDHQSSQIQLTRISLEFNDGEGSPINLADFLDEIRLVNHNNEVGRATTIPSGTNALAIQLSAPPVFSPGEIDTVEVQVTVKSTSTVRDFELRIEDASAFILRDVSSGAVVAAVTDTSLTTSNYFPVLSGVAGLRLPASASHYCIAPLLPAATIAGTDSLPVMDLSIKYPASLQYSPVQLQRLSMSVSDSLGQPLDPDRLFDRVGYRITGRGVRYLQTRNTLTGAFEFSFDDGEILVNPGDSLRMEIVADIEADAPYRHFVVSVSSADALVLRDATDRTHSPEFTPTADCLSEFPIIAGPTEVYLPAGRPTIVYSPLQPQIAFAGQTRLGIFRAAISYGNPSPEGDLEFTDLRGELFQRTASGLRPVAAAEVLQSVKLLFDGDLIAIDSTFSGNTLRLITTRDKIISAGGNIDLSMECDLDSAVTPGNYLIRFADSTSFGFVDKNLRINIHPILSSGEYPLSGTEIAVSEPNLEKSFSNYPNPFNPSRGEFTTFTYVLAEEARIDIELFTTSGVKIKGVVQDGLRAVGVHQSETWTGDDDDALDVAPGVYFCRIIAHYSSGKTESFVRKVAVVR